MWRTLQSLASLRSMRSLASNSRRYLCTESATASSTATPSPFHQRVLTMYEDLLNADWVDTEDHKPIEVLVEKVDGLIDEYRPMYKNNESIDDEIYKSVETLHFAKQAASICESYGHLCERTMRQHEGTLGFFGDNINIPEEKRGETIELFHDYIDFMNSIKDERVKSKVEMEWGRKMVHLKMFISMENFSVEVAPIAGDKILPMKPRQKELPTDQTKDKQAISP